MAKLNLQQTWVTELTLPELRLVLKALGDRLSGEEEFRAARELGDRLTTQRAKAVKDMARQADQLLEHVGEK